MISAAECRQHIEPHLETQTICDHRLHCPPCPPMAFWNRAGVGCFWLTYDPQKQFPSLEVRLTMSCSALWAVDLGWSDQDTFQAGTFGGFPTSRFAPPVLTSNWILIWIQLSQPKCSRVPQLTCIWMSAGNRQNVPHPLPGASGLGNLTNKMWHTNKQTHFKSCSFLWLTWGLN